MAQKTKGECHNIAAAFILMCQILGVTGTMEVGYMYPRAGRADTPPDYPWVGGEPGAWNKRYGRPHAVRNRLANHNQWENLLFIDGNGLENNFEGATQYGGRFFAIGESRIFNSPSEFYGRKEDDGWVGAFDVFFLACAAPYPEEPPKYWRRRNTNNHKLKAGSENKPWIESAFRFEEGPGAD